MVLKAPRGQVARLDSVNMATNNIVAARCMRLPRQSLHAQKNNGAATKAGRAPDHGRDADHRPSSARTRQATPKTRQEVHSPSEIHRIMPDRLDTTGSRVPVRNPNSDSCDIWI